MWGCREKPVLFLSFPHYLPIVNSKPVDVRTFRPHLAFSHPLRAPTFSQFTGSWSWHQKDEAAPPGERPRRGQMQGRACPDPPRIRGAQSCRRGFRGGAVSRAECPGTLSCCPQGLGVPGSPPLCTQGDANSPQPEDCGSRVVPSSPCDVFRHKAKRWQQEHRPVAVPFS